MKKGSKFEVPIPKKFRSMLRCLHLRNPFYEEEGPRRTAALAPWRRMALFFNPPQEDVIPQPFLEMDPFPALFTALDVPGSESIDELAAALADRLATINREMASRTVRQRMFAVNEMHCDAMTINLGQPDISKYQPHPFVEAYAKNGDVVRVAAVEPERLYRKGQIRLANWREQPDIHPLAKQTAEAIFGMPANVRFDHIETGPWGVRTGILGWNTRAMNMGALLAEIFAEMPEIYEEPKTGVFTDRYGRVCTFYGWILSADEMAAPDIMCRLLELIGISGHQRHHILRANKDVLQFLSETRLQYRETNSSVLSALFFGYLYLTPEEFQEVVTRLHTAGPEAAVRETIIMARQAGMGPLVASLFERLGIKYLMEKHDAAQSHQDGQGSRT